MPSNLENQVDHLAALLAQRFDRLLPEVVGGGDPNDDAFAPALRAAVAQVHDKLFETYFSWMTHVGLPARTPAEDEVPTQAEDKVTIGSYTYGASESDAAIAKHWREKNKATHRPDAGKQWACNAQLHRCLLSLLLGEQLD